MKKLFITLILLFALKSYAQSYYQNLFDSMGYSISVGNSVSFDQQAFSWGVPANMEALVLMYEKTHDEKYAKTLIKCIGNTIDRRDNLRDLLQLPNVSNISDYRGVSGAAWSTDHYNTTPGDGNAYGHLVHSANIIYPMAKFAAIIKKDSNIQNILYQSGGRYNNMTFNVIADDIIQKAKETINYHEDQWYTEPGNIGYYKERNDAPIEHIGICPFNMQSSIGRVFVQMYRATSEGQYLTKIRQLSNYIKLNTSFNTNSGANIWPYWNTNDLPEDISHGGFTMSFPYECYQYEISEGGSFIYLESDIKAYSNTFTNDLYRSPLNISGRVGHDKIWDIKNSPSGSLAYGDYISYMWLYLSKKNKPLYQMIADLQAAKNYYDHIDVEKSPLTLALLANYENFIVPVNTHHLWGVDSDWRGVAKGNFDGDSNDEFVTIRNYDGMIGTLEPYDKGFRTVTNSMVYSGPYNWKGLGAGDFFGDNKSEIIALSDHADFNNNGFYIFKIENNQIVEHSKFTGFGAESDWVGITAGDFISGGKDDFIAVRNYNKEVRVYKFNGTDPELVYFNQLNLPVNSKIKAVAAGNLDDDPKDEIVLLIDAEDYMQNGVYAYDIDDNGVMTLIDKSIGFGAGSDWKGLAVGNLDGDGADEIIAHRNFDGEYKIFKLNKSNGIRFLDDIGIESFPVLQTKDNVMCFGNFDPGSKNDELVTLRKDGGVVMFSAAKVIKNTATNPTNKQSDPCHNELPDVLFSFMKSASFEREDIKEISVR
ncbi:hypothetical protein WH221_12430 [Chryseobacterium culicis]|uniref:Repeat domain-containing protein n=1 Tax=Chryseobacterium culicis TaxID=680127 RepID=A0A2S9D2K5_CHRCI|nr:hypothetical protein [Chryseobacterium culicis]PRB87008.1 hypothetical protein CQ022_12410 [Chryseobacterium culicis]PRB92760.1 hypothetical protein CQ033_06080 [Chryseobacterium culicis]